MFLQWFLRPSDGIERKPVSAPWNLLSRLETSSTASLTAWTGSDTIWWMSAKTTHIIIIIVPWFALLVLFIYLSGLPGTVLYSTKSNITTPTASHERRATTAISSSADILSFPRSPRPLDLKEVVWGGATTPLDPVAARREEWMGDVRHTDTFSSFSEELHHTNFSIPRSPSQIINLSRSLE